MTLIENPITTHKHARWFALAAYLIGVALIVIGYLIKADWSVYLMILGLLIWTIPVMWCAYRWSKL